MTGGTLLVILLQVISASSQPASQPAQPAQPVRLPRKLSPDAQKPAHAIGNFTMAALPHLTRRQLEYIILQAAPTSPDLFRILKLASGETPGAYELAYSPRYLFPPRGSVDPRQMAAPITWTEFDRIGFVRYRKVASTSMHRFLLKLGYCFGRCKYQGCLYRQHHCHINFKCDENQPTYPCGHFGAPSVQRNFFAEKTALKLTSPPEAAPAIEAGRLFMVTVLRDPVKRVISEYYFSQIEDKEFDWQAIHPKAVKDTLQRDDFSAFVALGDGNPALNRQTLQILSRDQKRFVDWPLEHDEYGTPTITSSTINSSIRWLRACRLVLLAEYMPQGLQLFQHIFGGKDLPPAEMRTHFAHISRKSDANPSRRAVEANATLMQELQEATWADRRLYEEGKQIFFGAFKAMLESQGEQVDDIEEALARHAPAQDEVTASSASSFYARQNKPEPARAQAHGQAQAQVQAQAQGQKARTEL